MGRFVLFGLASLFTLSAAAATKASDWPGFHGGGALLGIASGPASDALSPLWTVKLGGPIKSSAAVSDGLVYVGSDDGKVYALDAAKGTTKWTRDAGGPIEAPPFVRGGLVYIGSEDGALYALDAATGVVKWKHATEGKILSGANVAILADGRERIVFGSYDHHLYGVDAKTGERAFAVETDNYVHATPAVEGTRVVFGGCDGVLRVVDATDGKLASQVKVGAYMAGSAALEGKGKELTAYIGHYGNAVVAVDFDANGAFWTYKDRDFPFFASPALSTDRLVVGGRDRRVHALDKETGKALWTFQTQGKVDSSPVIVDGRVVVGSADGRLYLLRLSDGKKLWSRDLGSGISATVAVTGGKVFIGTEDGRMHAFVFGGAKR
jgi:outer membrane protein assembly factor BamB